MPRSDQMLTVGELAEKVGKTPRALRLYEEMGLLVPRGRTCGGFRLYGAESLARLQFIQQLTDVGLPLEEIRALLHDVGQGATGDAAMAAARARFRERLAEVDAQMARLADLRDGLRHALGWIEKCSGCPATTVPRCCGDCPRHEGEAAPQLVVGMLACPDFADRTRLSEEERKS